MALSRGLEQVTVPILGPLLALVVAPLLALMPPPLLVLVLVQALAAVVVLPLVLVPVLVLMAVKHGRVGAFATPVVDGHESAPALLA